MMIFLSLVVAVCGEPQHYVYQGELAPAKENRDSPDVRFNLHFLEESPEADSIYWFLETSTTGSKIEETFGVFEKGATETGLPRIAYLRPENRHLVVIGSPWSLANRDLSQANHWSEGEFTVQASRVADTGSWRVEHAGKYGRKASALISQNGGMVTSYQRTLFMGQGVEHELRWKEAKRESVSIVEMQQAVAVIHQLQSWSDSQKSSSQEDMKNLPSGVSRLTGILRAATTQSKWVPFDRYVSAALRQVNEERNRDSALSKLAKKRIGKELADFELELIDGGVLSRGDLRDKIVVLHFWKYRTEPLSKPYGQVGYLDFLRRQMAKKDIAIIGVSVDPRAEKTAGRQAVIRDAQKMREFMNLSYPILVDDGGFLSAVGDPRTVGSALPLFVVIDRSQKISHFHPGVYPTEANAGLRELEKAIQAAAR